MKIRAILRKGHRIALDIVIERGRPSCEEQWQEVLGSICLEHNLSRPVLLSKHIRELNEFSRTVFSPADFIEELKYDKMEIELFSEDKENY